LPRATIATGRPATAGGRSAPADAADGRFERPTRRPKLGTIITIGFLIFWALRFFNNAGLGDNSPNPTARPTPRPTAKPAASLTPIATPHAARGQIVFGEEAVSSTCSLEQRANRFTIAADVYWEAEMTHVVDADATVLLIEQHDGVEIDRQEVPPDPDVGSWVRFCGGGPVAGYQTGVYRIEIWNADHTELLSSGSFSRFDPLVSPTPASTVFASLVGRVTFGTTLGAACTITGIGSTYTNTDAVWWRADLRAPVPAGANVRAMTLYNGSIIENTLVRADALADPRTSLCAAHPTMGAAAGSYVVQIWTEDRVSELATGDFTRIP
jgi:hypothetical protein